MKRYQWVAVSVSFVLAVTLWFLVTLNKQSYTTTFIVPVKLINFPNNLQLLNEFPEQVEVTTFGSGIKLFYQGLDPNADTVEVDFESFGESGHFLANQNLRLITAALNQGLSAVAVTPDSISLAFATKSNKKVPVVLDIEWDLPPSYRVAPGNLSYTDSVLVVGPIDSLQHVRECKTTHFKLPHSSQPQVVFIPLDSLGTMQMLPNPIKLTYSPQPYTERVMRLPVTAVGLPLDARLHLDPDSVEVKLLLPLDQFKAIHPHHLSAEVHFADLDERSPYVIPRVGHLPEEVELVSFSPILLRYMLITQE